MGAGKGLSGSIMIPVKRLPPFSKEFPVSDGSVIASDHSEFLRPTCFMDHEHPAVRKFVAHAVGDETDPVKKAVKLYYAVRDGIRYDPYRFHMHPENFQASYTVSMGAAFCIPKSILLGAAARAAGIPAKLGFIDVRNHLCTERLRRVMGSDVFIWHGYTAMYLGGQWIKATPAFNIEMCRRFGVLPLDFDGASDAMMHPYNARNERHMEYLKDRGIHADFPHQNFVDDMRRYYPQLVGTRGIEPGDFENEKILANS